MDLESIYGAIDAAYSNHLKKIQDFIRQPSISTENVGMKETEQLVLSYYHDLGCDIAEIVPTPGHSVVYGEYNVGAAYTLLIYFMHDVQPVDESKWSVPPFGGHIVDMELPDGIYKVLMNRGVSNTKSPCRCFLNAMETIKVVEGELPVNLIFVSEGEEELGSVNLPGFVKQYKEKLSKANSTIMPLAQQNRYGQVNMDLGVKGIVYWELECSGESWGRGPTKFDIHGSNKTWMDSPVWRLIHSLKTMTSDDGNTILIDHFYDKVKPLSPENLELIDRFIQEGHAEAFVNNAMDVFQCHTFIDDLQNTDLHALLTKYLASPTLNIDGIFGGWTGPGTKTLLPHKATVKMDSRIVPDQDSKDIIPLIRNHLDKHGFVDIKIKNLSNYEWVHTSVKAPIVRAAIKTYQSFGYTPAILPWRPGSAPFYLFNRILNQPVCFLGLGHGSRHHSPDEYFVVEAPPGGKVGGIREFEKSCVAFLHYYSIQS
ncbi:MAG: M20/M25/M40 family metallo-hydrolase [Candidatus Hodarchaeota archaeon]